METIEIGKYRINADERQFVVSQMKTNRSGVNKGKKTEVDFTYHSNLLAVAENVMKRKVLASKVSSIEGLIAEIKNQNKLMQKWFDGSLKAGIKIGKPKKKVLTDDEIASAKVVRKTVDKKPTKKMKTVRKNNK